MNWSYAQIVRWLGVAMLASALATGAALAQVDRDRQPKSETEGQAPSSGNPSERLNRTDGVIQPPRDVDPQMQVPPPESGSRTPVIPPPGTPGGDPSIEPK
jgi:hypothetical protein